MIIPVQDHKKNIANCKSIIAIDAYVEEHRLDLHKYSKELLRYASYHKKLFAPPKKKRKSKKKSSQTELF